MNDGGVGTLLDRNCRVPNIKNRADLLIDEESFAARSIEEPAHGEVRFRNELRKRGVFVSPSGARSIWLTSNSAYKPWKPKSRRKASS